jgi:hypothetical protein
VTLGPAAYSRPGLVFLNMGVGIHYNPCVLPWIQAINGSIN